MRQPNEPRDLTHRQPSVIAYRGLLLAIPALLGLPALAVLRRRLRDDAHDIAACAPGETVEVLGQLSERDAADVTLAGRAPNVRA
jgi:hypothetical protein